MLDIFKHKPLEYVLVFLKGRLVEDEFFFRISEYETGNKLENIIEFIVDYKITSFKNNLGKFKKKHFTREPAN